MASAKESLEQVKEKAYPKYGNQMGFVVREAWDEKLVAVSPRSKKKVRRKDFGRRYGFSKETPPGQTSKKTEPQTW